MNFQEIVSTYKNTLLEKYFCFEGRADRREFWIFILANYIVLFILDNIPIVQWISSLIHLAILLPTLGVGARRLHDTGKSGWFQLLLLIPIIGGIVVLILCAFRGEPSANEYGEPVGCAAAPGEEKKTEE